MAQNPSVTVTVSYPGSQLEPSFLDAKVTSTSVLNPGAPSGGTPYDAWCLNMNVQIPVPATYTATLYSSYELSVITASVPTLSTSAYLSNLDNINWLLNYYNGGNAGISFGEVQSAVWQLMGYKYPIAAYLAPQDVADINALVAQALAHDGYVPDAGESIGLVMDPTNAAGTTHFQPLIVETKAARLGDFVFNDLDADGVQDAGEQGIAGARVELVRDMNGDGQFSASEVLASTVTDAGGSYSFRGLTPGLNYQVRFTQPSGYDAVSPRQADGSATSGTNSDALVSSVVVLKPGEVNSGIDAGFYRYASVGDRAWHDVNGNGEQDAGEAGIAGVTVTLLDATGAVVNTTQTDANGNYAFTNLRPGQYDVQFATPNGFSVTRQHVGADASDSDINAAGLVGRFSLASGAAVTTVDAGFYRAASLGDRLWLDANGNGEQDAGEQGIAGQTVTLIGGGADGVIGNADDTTATMTTDADGRYHFSGLTPGVQYQVVFGKPEGSTFTQRDAAGDAVDSDADAQGVSQVVTLVSGEDNTSIDAGVYVPASIGDRAWEDSNSNGVQDTGEAGIAGVTVTLLDATGAVAGTTQTDADGAYAFTNLRPGVYDVQFATPDGFTVTRQHVGANGTDSDADATGFAGRYTLASGDAVTTVDAGFYRAASLGDRLWLDANGNGEQDAGEQGIAGQTVTLIGGGADGVIGNADDTTATMTTDAEGRYHFSGLTPGVQYQVVFGKPEGSTFTQRDAAGDAVDSDANAQGASQVVTLVSGEDNTSIDAGVYVPASIGDRAWEDTNGNGVQDTGEAGIAGVTVTLLDATGAVAGTTQTDATGAYAFTGLRPGQYDVQFATPNGFTVTRQHIGANATDSDADSTGFAGRYTLASGDAVTTVDAGFYRAASLGDRLWLDANGNGEQDAGEQGIAGQTVTLIGGGADGVIGNADDTTATMTTDADGRYHFSGLTPGIQYQVVFAKPEGSTFTQRAAAGDAVDSDADAQGASDVVTLVSGEDNTSIDAGVYVPASIGDRAWEDSNGNGVQDTGEAGIAGVTVTLLDATGAVAGTTQTDADGAYAFTNLRPGVYDVQFATPDGFTVTRQHIGANATDSDADSTGFAGRYTLASGDAVTTVDAGFYRAASLGDRLWLDANGNGEQDAGEQGIAGQTVTLIGGGADGVIGNDDDTTATMTTDAEGRYHFSGLTPGVQYQVVFGKPEGSVFTQRDAAGDAVDSDADAQGASDVVTLVSGEDNTSIDAGVYVPASIGDRAWEDSNGNGVQDTGEAGIAGVTVTLLDATGAVAGTTQTDADGAYAFTGLRPGQYDVQFATPDGFTVTRQHVGANGTDSDADATGFAGRYTLASGDAVTTVDAGFYRPATLGDRVWLDLNGNGQQDADEAGVSGVRVTLLDASGTAVGSPQLTDANGNYVFTGLAPGVYSVSFDPATLPAGYSVSSRDTTSGGPSSITVQAELGSGQTNLSGDLGLTGRVGLDIEKYVHGEVLQQSNGLGGEGLTPGFWKNHTGDGGAPLSGWPETGLAPSDSFESLFGVDVPGSAPTLLQALSANGGGVNALLRHASAALLNAANPNVDYFYSSEQIVSLVQQAFASGDYETVKNLLAAQNELGADLSTAATGTGSTLVISPDEDADTLDTAPVIAAGGQAVFTYEVTNTGTVALSGIKVNDDRIADVAFVGGDDDLDGQLDVGETWIYTAHETVQAGTVITNTGTASGIDAVSGRTASDSDIAIYTSTALSQSLGDRVWLDANANGLQDAGEAGFAGVTVQLKSATGTLLQTTTTDAEGNYAFNVAAGSYQLAVVVPTGYVLSTRDLGGNDATDSDFDTATHATTTVTVGAGQQVLTVDAGLHVAGTPGLDLEKLVHAEYYTHKTGGEGLTPGFWKNHTGDCGAPLSGWPETGLSPNASFEALFGVNVPGCAPTLLDALSANGGGVNALLRHAAAALLNASDPYVDYLYSREQVVSMVRQAFASGDYETTKNLFATQNELGADLTTPAGSASTLVVTADVDADTAASALVIPAAGTAVYTYVLTNTGNVALGNISLGDDRLSGISFVGGDTDRDGQLDVGETWTYTAREAVAAGATLASTGTASGRDAAGNVVRDSDAAHVGSSATVQTIGDKVWLDANANGVQDAGEAGLAGVTVKLLNTAGTQLQTAVTDANGNYAFNVAAGSYQLAIAAPTGYALSGRDRGGNDSLDSDFDAATGRTATVTVAAGQQNLTVDAGLYQSASLGDRVWCDANGNGVQDTGEAGVTGVTVRLLDAAGCNVLATTTTTTGGAYSFTGLMPGDYRVQVVRPSGYQAFTRANQGTNDLADSDVDANGLSGVVHLNSGTANASVDAGFAPNNVTLTYSFDGNTAVDGTDGNTRSYSVGGVSVTASAFSRDGAGNWSKAFLGAFSGGLGVTDSSESGSGVTHTIDNVGRLNFVVLQFSQNVVVDKAYLGYVYGDSDLTAWIGSSATKLTSLSDSLVNAMAGESNDTTSSSTRWADINAGGREGNVLIVAASVADCTPDDYFKLSQLVVNTKSTTITPLALDLDGDGVETVARADSAGSFDLLGNGQAVASGWIASDDALLARDVNGNGRIDDISELFGGSADGAGFARLAALDGNGDGALNASDAHFGELLAWRDLNGDHQSSANELMTLADAGIASLSVGYTVQPFWDAQGNLHLEHGVGTRADGSSLQVTDVHFDTALGSVAAAPAAVEEGGDLLSLLGTTLHTGTTLHALAV